MVEHFDGVGKQFENTAFRRNTETMLAKGYTFDYISDAQIKKLTVDNGKLKTEGNAVYKTIVIPRCRYIPISTIQKVFELADAGARVIFTEGFPVAPLDTIMLNRTKPLILNCW
jgi:hypothetical protein